MEPVGTFRAAINKTPHNVVVEERPIPQLGGTQVLVKMEAVGVCASDLHLTRRSNPYLVPKGDTGGHEGVGRIASLGPDVDTKAWKKGDRVAVRWVWWVCQKCELCLSGYEALCDKRLLGSVDVNGCWAEYAVADSRYLLRVPEGISALEAAPILCAGTTVYRALKTANLANGSWVAIVGAGGGLGHLAVQYAKLRGLRVLAIDGGDEKKALCQKLGADSFIDFTKTADLAGDAIKTTEGGAHGVIVMSSSSKAYEQAPFYVRKAGVLCCIGLTPTKTRFLVGPEYFVGKGVRLMGSSLGTLQDAEEALACLVDGKVKTIVVSKRLEDVGQCLNSIEQGESVGRFVINLDETT